MNCRGTRREDDRFDETAYHTKDATGTTPKFTLKLKYTTKCKRDSSLAMLAGFAGRLKSLTHHTHTCRTHWITCIIYTHARMERATHRYYIWKCLFEWVVFKQCCVYLPHTECSCWSAFWMNRIKSTAAWRDWETRTVLQYAAIFQHLKIKRHI